MMELLSVKFEIVYNQKLILRIRRVRSKEQIQKDIREAQNKMKENMEVKE
jgi:hypothetical protein